MGPKINTTRKGDDFEARVFDIFSVMLANDDLPISGKNSKIFRKRGYYSYQRKSKIVVDVSIECTLQGEDKPSMFLMIECKDYKHPVPVNDLEEFCNKTKQIVGLNVKAIFVTTNILQEGALNFAQSNGIRVMKIKPDGVSEVLSFRKEPTTFSDGTIEYINAFLALTSEIKSMSGPKFIGLGPGKVYKNFKDVLLDAISS